MKVYYYHTRPIEQALEEWRQHRHPGHILYGLPLLEQNGVACVLHRYREFRHRWMLSLYTLWQVLRCREPYDVLYGTSFRGLELVILLRALHLYRKPVAVWHHTAVTRSPSRWREAFSRLFYRGIDRMFFFSRKLLNDSVASGKAPAEKLRVIHWGADLAFYDRILADTAGQPRRGFISTGKENRDAATLLKAFAATGEQLDVYTTKRFGTLDYEAIVRACPVSSGTQVHFTGGIQPYELALRVARSRCVAICCLDFPYTVGLTTLVEAMALGLPVICSRNPNFEIDVEREGIGLTVDYGDVQGWAGAVKFIAGHPDEAQRMGLRARLLAEQRFNLEAFTKEIAEVFREVVSSSPQKT